MFIKTNQRYFEVLIIKNTDLIRPREKIKASGPNTSWQKDGETMETVRDFGFWAPKSLQMVSAAMKLKDA